MLLEEADDQLVDLGGPFELEKMARILEHRDADRGPEPGLDPFQRVDPDAAVPPAVQIQKRDVPAQSRPGLTGGPGLRRPRGRLAVVRDRGPQVARRA